MSNVNKLYAFLFKVESLLEKYDWIADEKKYFGQPNTVYDFNTQDPKEAEKRIQKLTETKNKLSKNVNVRAMNLLGSAEEQVRKYLLHLIIRIHMKGFMTKRNIPHF